MPSDAALAMAEPATRATRYSPRALAYEAFSLGERTLLLDPLAATSLNDALAETTSRWSWDRGMRLGIRVIGAELDQLHVFAVRRKSVGNRAWQGHIPVTEYPRWLDLIATIDLNVVAGLPVGCLGSEVQLHERRQRLRPEGARR